VTVTGVPFRIVVPDSNLRVSLVLARRHIGPREDVAWSGLTGTDTDRHPEEKRAGISIDSATRPLDCPTGAGSR